MADGFRDDVVRSWRIMYGGVGARVTMELLSLSS